MQNNLTELVFILDKSGSMGGLERDTVGGYNSMLEKQKAVDGECRVTTVLFNGSSVLLHDRADIRAVEPITEREYSVGGSTALVDAIGIALTKIENAEAHTSPDYRAGHVVFVIITDGEENASREYTAADIKRRISRRREEGWEFIFLGANIDAVSTAREFGIDEGRAVDYVPDSHGTALNFKAMSAAVSDLRECGAIKEERFEEIRSDARARGGKKK